MALAEAANAGASAFINCILEDEPNLDMGKASQTFFRDKLAKHYFGLTTRLRDRCLPALEEVRKALQKDPSFSEQVAAELEAYKDKVVSVAKASDDFVRASQARDGGERAFHAIDKAAGDWESAPIPADPAPFERFYACAVPGLGEMKDADTLFRFIKVHIPEAFGQGFRFNVGAHSGVTWAHIPGTWAARTRLLLTQRRRRGDRGRQRAVPGGTVAEWNVTLCAESKKFSDYISTAT